jgi:hypothetical protein
MKGVSLSPNGAPQLLKIEEINTSLSLGHLLVGDVQLGTLHMKNGYVQMVRDSLELEFPWAYTQ